MNRSTIERIINLRELRNWSQKDLADKMGFNKVTMNKIEHGNRSISNEELSKFADIFEVTTDYLLGKNGAPQWANKHDIADLKQMLDDNVGLAYGGEDLTEEDKKRLNDILTGLYWEKLHNKKKRENQE